MALAEQHSLEERVSALTDKLAALPGAASGSPAEVLVFRTGTAALGAHLREARDEAVSHHAVVEGARARWHADKAQLSAVENLLERRAARRRAERAKAETKELDDLASVRWAREAQR